jgi:hypothetical protein
MLLFLENIDHRQRDNDRDPEFEQLRDQVKVAFEIGRIHNRNYHVGTRYAANVASQHFAGDRFIYRCRFQAVKPGQIY